MYRNDATEALENLGLAEPLTTSGAHHGGLVGTEDLPQGPALNGCYAIIQRLARTEGLSCRRARPVNGARPVH